MKHGAWGHSAAQKLAAALRHTECQGDRPVSEQVVGRVRLCWFAAHQPPAVHQAARCVFEAQVYRVVFTWNGVSSGCLARISATMPVICGAAKLLPVLVLYCLFT